MSEPIEDAPALCARAAAAAFDHRWAEAVDLYQAALDRAPTLRRAVWGLAEAWLNCGEPVRACAWYRRYLELVPGHPVATHMVAALGGTAPARASDGYIVSLFDDFADSFDRLMTDQLDYRAPQYLRDAVQALLAHDSRLNILDAGCGTGLAGVLFRPLARRLEGVDLSPMMIRKARARGIYDALRVAELTAALRAAAHRFDLVVAADVLVYFGDLAPVLGAARAALAPGGLFAFTGEAHDGTGWALTAAGRYAHGEDHVRGSAASAGLRPLRLERAVIRRESGHPVDGLVVVLRTA
jgi:predicted TPR repeat methyltransferase